MRKCMLNRAVCAVIAGFVSLATQVQAGVVFTEDWSGAPLGAITVPGGTITTSAHTWTSSGSGTPPPAISILNSSGNLILENTVVGSASSSIAQLTASPVSGFVTGKAITVEFDIRDYTPSTTTNQRFYVLLENSTSLDGYRIRFSSQVEAEEIFNSTIIDNAVEVGDRKYDDSNNGIGGFGMPNANGEWHAKMTFIPLGADTKILYEVTGLNGSPNMLAPGTFTHVGAAAQDVINRVHVWCRRPLASIDNLVISQDTTAPVITLLGNATVNLGLGCTSYVDAGATALDNVEGNLTANINVVSTVNTAVAGSYTVTYTLSDSSANAATPVVRNVIVSGSPNPVVTLNGADPLLVSCATTFSDPGATAVDRCGNTITAVASGAINMAVPGNYTRVYTATDSSSNVTVLNRTVTVQNDCPQIIMIPTTPTSISVEIDGSAQFGITASGTGTLTYEWYFDDGSGPVALSVFTPDITISSAQYTNTGTYYCQVTDDLISLPSPTFTLTVTAQVPVGGVLGLGLCALITGLYGVSALRRQRS